MKVAFFVLVLIAAGVSPAAAHPFTIETVPVQFSNAPVGTSEIVMVYSENVEIGFSTLRVIDGNGDQIDNGDTRYYEGEHSLAVTTPPLEEGTYTVTSKVLSKVDGHLVDYAFVFAIGEATVKVPENGLPEGNELIFLPEAGARFPGLVGQTLALGAVLASIFIWGTQRKDLVRDGVVNLEKIVHRRFVNLVGAGLILVFASNIMMIAVQSWRLEAQALEILGTSFGSTWVTRMAITVALLGVWFYMDRVKRNSLANQIPLLILSLALIATTTMLGHGMASEQYHAVALDYIHNLVAAAWIGGIVFFAFVLLPSFSALDGGIRERISLAAIPRFSIMIVISVGIVIISGPLLIWSLESDLETTVESTYGKLIAAKILLASAMVGMGSYYQFGIQRRAERNETVQVIGRMKRALRVEIGFGIALLAVVALLVNGTLPSGEVLEVEAQETMQGFTALEFTENVRFEIEMFPYGIGPNAIKIIATDLEGDPLSDLDGIKMKVSNPLRSIAPIAVPVEPSGRGDAAGGEFVGNVTFGFSGVWQLEIEAQRVEHANEGRVLQIPVKPRLDDLVINITEYDLPGPAAPLQPTFYKNNIWMSDTSGPQIWKFSIQDGEFQRYGFEGKASTSLAFDGDGKAWFTDTMGGAIGYIESASGESDMMQLPDIPPVNERSYPVVLDVDGEERIWVAVTNKDALVMYDQEKATFETYDLQPGSRPFSVAVDDMGKVWLTYQGTGSIAHFDPETGEVKEFAPDPPLATPETITFDSDGSLWVAEHNMTGGIVRYDPFLESFKRIPYSNDAAFPNSVAFDRYDNAWFALHTVDAIAVYDPHREEMRELPIWTPESWILFMTSDDADNIWFVEQKPAKLATLQIIEKAGTAVPEPELEEEEPYPGFAQVTSPLIALGIIFSSLFFVKGVKDKRRIDSLVNQKA